MPTHADKEPTMYSPPKTRPCRHVTDGAAALLAGLLILITIFVSRPAYQEPAGAARAQGAPVPPSERIIQPAAPPVARFGPSQDADASEFFACRVAAAETQFDGGWVRTC